MPKEDEFKPIENMLAHANPNPQRVGCPSAEKLKALALRERAADDPLYVHVSQCSPCYVAIRELQLKHGVLMEPTSRPIWPWLAVAAAVICMVAGGAWYFTKSQSPPPPLIAKSQIQLPSTILDLRPYAVVRSDENPKSSAPLAVGRGRQNVTLVLPVASAAGQYALKLLDENLSPKMTSNPNAKLSDGVTSITTELDLTEIAVGRYTLALKREPEDWRYFPLVVR